MIKKQESMLEVAEKLMAEGVTLTPGQLLGKTLKGLEERATGLPIVGEMIRSSRNKGIEEFNKAAYKRAVAPIGGDVPEVTGMLATTAALVLIRKNTSVVPALVINHAGLPTVALLTANTVVAVVETFANTEGPCGLKFVDI